MSISDPFREREAQKYENPIPSREAILALIEKQRTPVSRDELTRLLKLEGEEQEEALRRRLRGEGQSFSAIRDEMRQSAARIMLTRSAAPVAEIAARLGYAEPSVFTRAFRRWTGATPGQWRGRGAADMRAQPPAA